MTGRDARCLLSVIAIFVLPVAAQASDPIDEIVVTSSRAPTSLINHQGNIAVLNNNEVQGVAHAHIHELMTRVAGVWVTRGSGQESLPSIRSPVLTGAGSCGAFLTLEDGIPIRPNGFCNVNQLFEIPTELAERIEVVRGPGNALYGSNALHGTINVLLPEPQNSTFANASLELGANEFIRAKAAMGLDGQSPVVFGAVVADDSGFREDSGYRQAKAYVKKAWATNNGSLTGSLTVSDLDQETAGFILGEDAYKDPALNRQNLNPEAYRDANSQRLSLHLKGEGGKYDIDIRPYVRRSEMVFLQHFLPGKPLEENRHVSLGVLANTRYATDGTTIEFGFDVDASDVYLRETQFGPTEGSDFLRETRPEGKHYDYGVKGLVGAAYVQAEFRPTDKFAISGGLRAEFANYDYDNRMLNGNTRDDGTPCGFGGCLYTRPEGRSDDFADIAPKLGVVYSVSDATTLYSNIARGFRIPQLTELYRLQSGQQVSDLKAETVDSVEVGIRSDKDDRFVEASAFAMQKKNSVYRDANGFNVSGGQSRHVGVELDWEILLHDYWIFSMNGTYAKHTYDFDVVAARGETFVSGRDIDTAPRWQGGAAIRYDGPGRIGGELQWTSLGSYFLDAENQYSYPGHELVNLRLTYEATDTWSVVATVKNLADVDYADRADFAFGNYRYFPGRGRELFLRVEYLR